MSDIYHQNFVKTVLNGNSTEEQIFSSIDLYFKKHLELDIQKSLLNKIIKIKRTFIFKYMLENCYDYNLDHQLVHTSTPNYSFMRFTIRNFLNPRSNLDYYINILKYEENYENLKNEIIYIDNLKKSICNNNFSINMNLTKIFSELNHPDLTQSDFDNFMLSFNPKISLDFFIIFLMNRYNINNIRFTNFVEYFIYYLHKNNFFPYLIKKHDEFTFSFKPLLGHPLFIEFLSKHIHKNNIKNLFPIYERHIKNYFEKNNQNSEYFKNLFISYFNLKHSSDLYYFINDLIDFFKHHQIDTTLFLNLISNSNIKSLFHPKSSFFSTISTYDKTIFFDLFKYLLNNPESLTIFKNNIHSIHPDLKSYILILDF